MRGQHPAQLAAYIMPGRGRCKFRPPDYWALVNGSDGLELVSQYQNLHPFGTDSLMRKRRKSKTYLQRNRSIPASTIVPHRCT